MPRANLQATSSNNRTPQKHSKEYLDACDEVFGTYETVINEMTPPVNHEWSGEFYENGKRVIWVSGQKFIIKESRMNKDSERHDQTNKRKPGS